MTSEVYEAWLDARAEWIADNQLSECDACGKMKRGCVMIPACWTHPEANACPECRGDSPENF